MYQNQTKKRLNIIKLAISITDIETIQLQMLKLGMLKTDTKVQEIMTALNANNYAHAQALITTYLETPTQEILQRSSQDVTEAFDLFATSPEEEQKNPIDLDVFIPTEPSPQRDIANVDYTSLLNIKADDILTENIQIDISHTPEDNFFKEYTDESLTEDTFFHTDDETAATPLHTEEKENNLKTDLPAQEQYNAIANIHHYYKELLLLYPPIQEGIEAYSSVDKWLLELSDNSYNDATIERLFEEIENIRQDDKAQAAQLLLISAATEAKFAHFMLARELYRGELLQKNLTESLTLMNHLAINENYPEAICDLAQFYEKGIGLNKDPKRAEALYKEAMELGIKRAQKHYKRLHKQNRGLFTIFKR